MGWGVRFREQHNAFHPKECSDYKDNKDLFTIKLFHGGNLSEDCNDYVGGQFSYIDCCDVDQISFIEITAMCKEVGEVGAVDLYYKSTESVTSAGLWPLETDEDVLEMCALIPDSRLVPVYCICKPPLSTIFPDGTFTQTQPEVENYSPNTVKAREKAMIAQIYEADGLHKDFSDLEDEEEQVRHDEAGREDGEVPVPEVEASDHSCQSFHGDSSNMDSTDEDVREFSKQKKGENQTVETGDKVNDEEGREDSDISSDSSKYLGSDEEIMAGNSTDEEEDQYPVFNEQTDMGDPKFELGMLFASLPIFRAAVKKYAIVQRRPIVQSKNYGGRARFTCEKGCEWRIYCSKMQNSETFQVKRYNPTHTCRQTVHQKQINSTWVAEYYEDEIRMNPTWPLTAFQAKVVNDWNCEISIWAIGRAKRRAMDNINGKHVEQYRLVYDYRKELLKAMPDSTVLIVTEAVEGSSERRFQRMYICFGPIKRGFRSGCRPLVGLDGCHLKGPYGGQLLAAVGVDANDGMYPIAWAVVEAENNDSWNWFLDTLKEDLDIENEGGWTFISDRQKGLINALEAVFPSAEHRFCVMHLYRNMWKEYKGIGLRMCLWKAARATNEYMFDKSMEDLKKLSRKCYNWLMEKPRSQWSRSAFRAICKSDMFVNNHCEVFNSTIRKFRDLPIVSMLKAIHRSVMTRIQKRRDKMMASYVMNPICPNAMRRLNKAIEQTAGCNPLWSGGPRYSVTMTSGGFEMVVDLDAKTCICKKWQLSGIPCYHACSVMSKFQKRYEDYIHECYSKDNFLKCYENYVEPICGEELWEKTSDLKPLPPVVKVQPGRPKKRRSRRSDVPTNPTKLRRQHTTTKCSYCLEFGHNFGGCAARKNDEKNGIFKEVKRRIAKSKKNENIEPDQGTEAPVSLEAHVEPTPPQSTNTKGPAAAPEVVPTLTSVAPTKAPPNRKGKEKVAPTTSQAGIFSTTVPPTRVNNTPLGIQPERFNVPGKSVTSLRNLQQAAKERKDNMAAKKKPGWKI